MNLYEPALRLRHAVRIGGSAGLCNGFQIMEIHKTYITVFSYLI